MPVIAPLPNLDQVYAKWENRGPKSLQSFKGSNSENGVDATLQAGRRKWQEKFGGNVKPLQRRRIRDRPRVAALSAEAVQTATIAQFKMSPSILPEHFSQSRPFMGHCCSCMPNSQKDLITDTTSSEGLRNILDVRHELRGSGVLSRQFATLVYTWRTRTQHRYPELSMAVLTNQRLIDVIHSELLAEEVKLDRLKLEKRARDILNKMKSKVSNILTKFTGWFLHHFLGLLISGLHVHKGQMNMVRAAAQRDMPLLFLPLHKSHLDYILITFIMWNYEIKNPNIAAGDNLNIPFFSYLMRGLGGFFIRRKLDKHNGQKDKIYRAVLHTYMEQLLAAGENMEFFPEGGRSRTGKPLLPKGGLMSVVLDSISSGVLEDIYVVPVSISYEKLLDGNFNTEQMGIAKTKETFVGAVRGIWSVLRGHYGNVRVDFAQPFSFKECMQACSSNGNSSPESSSNEFSNPGSPTSASPSAAMVRMSSTMSLYGTDVVIENERELINKIGLHVVHTCTQTQALMSSHLLSFLLLTRHRQGASLDTLAKDFSWLKEEVLLRKRDVGFSPSSSSRDVICYALTLMGPNMVRRSCKDGEEKIVPCTDIPAVFELSYYSNHVISVFLLESIVVSAVICLSNINLSTLNVASAPGEVILMSRDEILETAADLCKLLKHDFIPVPPCVRLEEALADTLDQLVTTELLKQDDHFDCDAYENSYDRQWANRVSDKLSFVDGDEEDDYDNDVQQMLRVNLEEVQCKEKLLFLHSVLAPFFEAYLLTGHHVHDMLQSEMTEADFMKSLHEHAKSRVMDGVASYSESAALETLRNAVKSFKDLRIIDSFNVSNVTMVELHGRYNVRDSLKEYIQMLENLRG